MSDRLHVRVDLELQRELAAFAKRNGLTISQAARELLRQALGHAEPVSRGWREGFSAGFAEVQQKMQGAAREAAETPPDRRRLPPWMQVVRGGQK